MNLFPFTIVSVFDFTDFFFSFERKARMNRILAVLVLENNFVFKSLVQCCMIDLNGNYRFAMAFGS